MLFENITILDENYQLQSNMYVGIKDDKITYIGKEAPVKDFGSKYKVKGNKILMPGFFNAHAHIPMSILRSHGGGLNLSDWLNTKIFPFEGKLTEEDVYNSTLLGIAESLKFGIVCHNDMYMKLGQMCKAYAESGIKANVNDAAVCFDERDFKELPCFSSTVELMKEYNTNYNGRVQVEFGLHAEYTSTEKIVRGVADACKEYNSPVHVHVSETAFETEECKKRRNGRTPVEYLHDCGLFDVRATAAHCVHITENDAKILAEKNVTIGTCPISNLKLASGIMPAKLAMDHGINIAVGTDGVASNNNVNYLEDLKFYSLIHKGASGNPTLISLGETFYAGTRAGALAMGRLDSGIIKEGFKADLIIVDGDGPHMQPPENMLDHLIYSSLGSDICLTMVDGQVLYKDGEYLTIDVEKAIYNVKNSFNRIITSI